MNELLFTLGIEGWKPVITALILPPLPFLVLIIAGARVMFRRRLLSWSLILLGVAGVWLFSTIAVGQAMTFWLLQPPRPLSESEIGDLKKAPKTAIIVLGGGRRLLAPEYGLSTLHPRSIERLRFGIWLSRETGLPLGFSGGVGNGALPGPSEAEIAARIADREFGRPLRWQEGESRDTRENALRTVALLQPQGIEQIVLVTHAYHMRRALGLAALEAGREMNDKWHPYIMIAAIFMMFLFPGVYPSTPRYSYLNVLYMGRFIACGSAAASLLISSRGVGCWRWTPHAILWALYCASDASTYLAVLRGVHDQAGAFVMCFHCGCLAGWIWLWSHRRSNEI